MSEKVTKFIGKYYTNLDDSFIKPYSVLISDIRYAPGYPEHFEPYYSIYTIVNGKEKWIINLPESEFHYQNPEFTDEPIL